MYTKNLCARVVARSKLARGKMYNYTSELLDHSRINITLQTYILNL